MDTSHLRRCVFHHQQLRLLCYPFPFLLPGTQRHQSTREGPSLSGCWTLASDLLAWASLGHRDVRSTESAFPENCWSTGRRQTPQLCPAPHVGVPSPSSSWSPPSEGGLAAGLLGTKRSRAISEGRPQCTSVHFRLLFQFKQLRLGLCLSSLHFSWCPTTVAKALRPVSDRRGWASSPAGFMLTTGAQERRAEPTGNDSRESRLF